MKIEKYIFLVLVCLSSISCNNNKDTKKTALASYKGESLYLEDIQSQFRPFLSKEDSIQQTKALSNSWLRQHVLLDYAAKNIGDSIQQFEKRINDYKNSLYIYHYENQLSKDQLDTAISDSILNDYYKRNKKNFELKRNIVKIWYAKFTSDFNKRESFLPYFKENTKEAEAYVKEFSEQYATNYFVSSSDWLYFDEIRKEIPLDPSYDQSAFIRNNKFRQFKDQEYVYFLKIVDYKVKQSLSPYELVKGEIKQMILNKRRVDLLRQNQINLVKKALENGDAKII